MPAQLPTHLVLCRRSAPFPPLWPPGTAQTLPNPRDGFPTRLSAEEDGTAAHRSLHLQRGRTQTRPPRSLSKLTGRPAKPLPSLQGAYRAWVSRRGRGGDSPSWMGVSPGAATAQPPPLGPSRRRRAPPEDSRVSSLARLLRAAGLRPPRGSEPAPIARSGAGVRGPRRALARPPNAQPERCSGPVRPRPGPAGPAASPRPPAPAWRGGPTRLRARPSAPATHSPRARRAGRAAAERRGRAGPARPALHKVTAPELRGGGAWAPEVPPPGPAPPAPTGGHFRSRGVESGSRRGRAWRERKSLACEGGRSGCWIPAPPLGTPVPQSWEPELPLPGPETQNSSPGNRSAPCSDPRPRLLPWEPQLSLIPPETLTPLLDTSEPPAPRPRSLL